MAGYTSVGISDAALFCPLHAIHSFSSKWETYFLKVGWNLFWWRSFWMFFIMWLSITTFQHNKTVPFYLRNTANEDNSPNIWLPICTHNALRGVMSPDLTKTNILLCLWFFIMCSFLTSCIWKSSQMIVCTTNTSCK